MTEYEWLNKFRLNLLRLIDENRYSQLEVAEMIGVSESSISKYVRGSRMPSARVILNLSYAFNCSTDELIDFGEAIEK